MQFATERSGAFSFRTKIFNSKLYRWTAQDKNHKILMEREENQKSSAISRKDCNRVDMAASVRQGSSTEEMEKEKAEASKQIDTVPQEVVKHPLQCSWTLWFYENDRNKSWEDNQVEIYTFNTVEDFWSLVNHIKPASELRQGTDYSLFKQGVRPMWEDPGNKNGGRWLISLDRKQRGPELDNCWLEVMLCLIGEAFDDFSDDVCGAVMNIRQKGDKIGLWTADGNRTSSIIEIGQRLKNRLKIPAKVTIGYQFHRDLVVKNSSAIKNRYQV